MLAVIKTKINYLGYSYPDCFQIENSFIERITSSEAESIIENNNLRLDLECEFGQIFVDKNFKQKATKIKDLLIHNLENIE